jgi:hypothetical protein
MGEVPYRFGVRSDIQYGHQADILDFIFCRVCSAEWVTRLISYFSGIAEWVGGILGVIWYSIWPPGGHLGFRIPDSLQNGSHDWFPAFLWHSGGGALTARLQPPLSGHGLRNLFLEHPKSMCSSLVCWSLIWHCMSAVKLSGEVIQNKLPPECGQAIDAGVHGDNNGRQAILWILRKWTTGCGTCLGLLLSRLRSERQWSC